MDKSANQSNYIKSLNCEAILQGDTYESWVLREYTKDMSPHAAAKAVSKLVAKVAFMRHLLDQADISPSAEIISAGGGGCHEQALLPSYNWINLEVQSKLVQWADQRNSLWSLKGRNVVWDVFKDDLPKCDVLLCCHFCGGGTDISLENAAASGVKTIIVMTCCANRWRRASSRVLNVLYEDYSPVAKQSGDKTDHGKGREAQELINNWRAKFLESCGYSVSTGWFNNLATGGWLIGRV